MGLFDRHSRSPQEQEPQPTSGSAEPGSPEALATASASLTPFLRKHSGQIPGRAYVVARTIANHLADVVADPSSHLLDVGSRISLERMATTHIPETITTYLGARSVPNADAMLTEQLSTMERVAAKAAARSIEAARDAFLIQGSFLEDKYGAGYA